MHYGPSFQLIEKIYFGHGEALSVIKIPDSQEYQSPPLFFLTPPLQTLIGTMDHHQASDEIILPVIWMKYNFFFYTQGQSMVPCPQRKIPKDHFTGNLKLCDEDGRVFVEIRGATCRLFKRKHKNKIEHLFYHTVWDKIESPKKDPVLSGQNWALIVSDANSYRRLKQHLEHRGAKCFEGLADDIFNLENLHVLYSSITEINHSKSSSNRNQASF